MVELAPLGIVMPVYNEGSWVDRSITALELAAQHAGWPIHIVVVDDGSTDSTVEVLDALAQEGRITLVRKPNGGRFAARLDGLAAQDCDFVLLLDARVLLDPGALRVLRGHVAAEPVSAWNAHVNVHTQGNVWAAFWSALTKVFWRRYFAKPRLVSFGPEDFDAYPKGTGAFAAPREAVLRSATGFSSMFAQQNLASDDTRLLRSLATGMAINIDPGFSCEYFGRDSAAGWARQVLYRGTTFVDGYIRTRGRALIVAALFAACVIAIIALGIRAVAVAAVLVCLGWIGVWAVALRSGTTPAERRALVGLLPVFGVLFGAGFLRGLALGLRSRD